MHALRTLRAEHRSLAAVIHGLAYLVREAVAQPDAADFALLATMLRYIEAFPERFHHPKEDAWLFARLRLRHPPAAPLLDRLQGEHAEGAQGLAALRDALAQWQDARGDPAAAAANGASFAAQAEAYAALHRDHMRREELEVMPLCELHLTEADWADIDAAFATHADPLSDTNPAAEFAELFRRIVDTAPPPVGRALR